MARKKEPEPEKIKGGELFDVAVILEGHIVWPRYRGIVVAQFTDNSVTVFTDQRFHVKARALEFEIATFKHKNIPL